MSKIIGLLFICILSIYTTFAGTKYSADIDEIAVKEVVNDAIAWQIRNMPIKGGEIWYPQFTGRADSVF